MNFLNLKSIRTKIILSLTFSCFLFGIVFIFYTATEKERELKEKLRLEAYDNFKVFKSEILEQTQNLKSDLKILSTSPLFDNLDTDFLTDQETSPEKYSALQRVFSSFLQNRIYYSQIRLLGRKNKGQEVIRVDKDLNGRISPTPKQQLQQKGDEFYFKEIIKFNRKEIYFSSLTFNKEFGVITEPKQLMLRGAIPIFSNKNVNLGFIIINLDFSKVLSKGESLLENSEGLVVTDGKNKIIYTGKDKFDFFQIPKSQYLTNKKIDTSNDIIQDKLNFINNTELLQFHIYYDSDLIDQNVTPQLVKGLQVVLLISLALLIFAFAMGTNITRPIKRVTEISKSLEHNKKIDFSQLVSPKKDEIGILIDSFYRMSEDIMSINHRLQSHREALDAVAIVAETDAFGVITFVNKKFLEISQFSESELIGKTHQVINSGYHTKSFFEEFWTTIKAGKIWRGEIKNKAKDGSHYWVDTTIFPEKNQDGKIEKFISIRFDITENKQKEELLEHKIRDEVQRRVGQDRLIAQQSKMAEMGNMISAITHQWKQPLNAILMSSQLISDECETKPIKIKNLIEIQDTIEYQVDFLNQTVHDFSDYLRPSKEPMRFEVNESIQKILNIFKPQLELDSIEVEINHPSKALAFGFDNEFKQVIFNIINNAKDNFVEKGVKNPKIVIEIEEEESSVIILIHDNGGGIPPVLLPEKIFEPYISTKGPKGTGIGLTLARRIIEISMNGDIIAYNNKEGATFKIILPNLQAKTSKLNYSILFAEDEDIAREVISSFLSKNFKKVTVAKNGVEAIEEIEKSSPDLIVTDINMPLKNGNRVADYVKETNKDAIMVALTSVKEDITHPEYFDSILEKPIRKKQLLEELKKVLPKLNERS